MPVRYLDEQPSGSPSASKQDPSPRIPALDFIGGAGNTVDKTFIKPLNRLFGSNLPMTGDPEASETMAGKIGETGLDMGLMAATPAGKFKILAPALTGTAQHQLQTFGQTGEVDPGMAAGEMAVSTALPFVGGKLGGWLKNLGIGSARRGLSPAVKNMKGANPIDFEYALENRHIPFWGGASKMKPRLEARSGQIDENLAKMLEEKGVSLNNINAAKKTDDVIAYLEGKSKLNSGAGKAMGEAREQAVENAAKRASSFKQVPTGKFKPDQTSALADQYGVHTVTPGAEIMRNVPENVPGRAARDVRKLADENARYDRASNPVAPPGATYNRIYRNQIEGDLSKKMNATDLAAPYAEGRQELRKITPLLDLAANADAKTPKVGLGFDLLTAGAGAGSVLANPYYPLAAAGTIATRRLLSSPGGGRMLYEAGRGADNTAVRKGGKYMLDLARSAQFSPNQGRE
ncbi:MAG: hypothetical protein V4563_17170 [Pseudomonadota bacterium]